MTPFVRCHAPRCGAIALLTLALLSGCTRQPQPVPAEYALPVPVGKALETVQLPSPMPDIGKWMVAPSGQVANWLGQPVDGKELCEPINIIILDPIATTVDAAQKRLVAASAAAGFLVRSGHSSGYGGIIDGRVYPEMPAGPGDAFSDEPFVLSNNHGRIFGPHPLPEGWMFIGAFSREAIEPTEKVKHGYASMNRSRDAYARGMATSAGYSVAAFPGLANAIVDGAASCSTGDHDGVAVLLRANR